jgi:Tfp pilus assembly ATPase PilU
MLGEQLNPILLEIEDIILEFEAELGEKPNYSLEGFRAATKIFMSTIMDKLWELQEADKISQDDRENMATKCGEDLRKFIKTYTDIDTFDLYK